MRLFCKTVLFLLIMISTAHAYAPPELIWYKQGDHDHVYWFYDYTWIGDQNGDGCDELLVSHEPYLRGGGRELETFTNRVDLHYGGVNMSQEPDVTFHARHERETMGLELSYLGNLTGNGDVDFAIKRSRYDGENEVDARNWYIDIYQGGEEFDTIPDFTISSRDTRIYLINNDRPCDINGDGYNDLLVRTTDFRQERTLRIYYGGADFDTIPDDVMTYPERGWFGHYGIKSGFDLNGDGMDEIIIRSRTAENRAPKDIYLVGVPVDSIIFTLYPEDYDGYNLSHINMFADVNGDGYDDFGFGIFGGNLDCELSAQEKNTAPSTYELMVESYPNPFNQRVKIQVNSHEAGQLKLQIYDLNGRLVERSSRSIPLTGGYTYTWDAGGHAAGIYILEVEVETEVRELRASQKLLLLR